MTPWRNITRRSVITKWVERQFNTGHSVSHPTMMSQITPMTSITMFLADWFPGQVIDDADAESRHRGHQQQRKHGADQALPMRMPV